MARPRKPTGLHAIDGTLSPGVLKARQEAEKSAYASPIGAPPEEEWFDEEMHDEWNRITSSLSGVLAASDRITVIHHCSLYKKFLLDMRGLRSMTSSERNTFHSVQMQLGATPSSRAKAVSQAVQKPDDPWAKFA